MLKSTDKMTDVTGYASEGEKRKTNGPSIVDGFKLNRCKRDR